jgi:hypothetical protein
LDGKSGTPEKLIKQYQPNQIARINNFDNFTGPKPRPNPIEAKENNLPELFGALQYFLANACQPPMSERKQQIANQPPINNGKNQRKSNSDCGVVIVNAINQATNLRPLPFTNLRLRLQSRLVQPFSKNHLI